MKEVLLELKNVNLSHSNNLIQQEKDFSLNNISFQIKKNSSMSLIGESASGKSSLIMALMLLHPIDSGQILYKGKDVKTFSKKELINYQKSIQPVFQNYDTALNPFITIYKTLYSGFCNNLTKDEKTEEIYRLIEMVELDRKILYQYPHQLSGGEKQRISLIRALVTLPEIIILDEPFSALDIVNQQKLMQLLLRIKKERQIAFLFITHKIPLTRFFSNNFFLIQEDGMHSFDKYEDLVRYYE